MHYKEAASMARDLRRAPGGWHLLWALPGLWELLLYKNSAATAWASCALSESLRRELKKL